MPQAGFETTIPASERSKPHALDRGATQEKICDPYIRDLYRSPAITGEVKWRKSTVCLTCGSDGERRNGNDWGCKISYKSTNFNLCQNTGINMWDIIVVKDVYTFRATTPAFRGEGGGGDIIHLTSILKKQRAGSFEKLVLNARTQLILSPGNLKPQTDSRLYSSNR